MKLQRTSRFVIEVVLIAVFGIVSGCSDQTSTDKTMAKTDKTTAKEVKQEMQDVLQALQGYAADQRDEAVRKTKTVLDNLDSRIDALETNIDNNWDRMDKAAREKARANLKALRKQRMELAEWYGSLKSSSADAWEHAKKGFSDAYKALSDAWEKAVNEF
jgi:nitrate/TMAO reductase-like tetraheme cytochrome c subunit